MEYHAITLRDSVMHIVYNTVLFVKIQFIFEVLKWLYIVVNKVKYPRTSDKQNNHNTSPGNIFWDRACNTLYFWIAILSTFVWNKNRYTQIRVKYIILYMCLLACHNLKKKIFQTDQTLLTMVTYLGVRQWTHV